MVKHGRKCGAEGGKRGTKRVTRGQQGTSQHPSSSFPTFPPTYPYVPTMSLQAAAMDVDPHSEGLCGRDPPRPPCAPVSPCPKDKACLGVPKGHNVPVSCRVPPSGPPKGIPNLEVLLRQIHSLQKVRQATEQELMEAQDRSESLHQHLEQLEQREQALEGLWKEVQESLRRARLQGKEVEAKGQRCRGLCLEQQQDLACSEQRLQQLRELRRGHRQEFWQQLDAIIEEHRHLHDTHAPAHLEAELMRLAEMREKWLSWECHLREMEEQLGPQAPLVTRLVEEEQQRAQRKLEVELGRKQLSLERRDRLAEELQQLQRLLEAPPE